MTCSAKFLEAFGTVRLNSSLLLNRAFGKVHCVTALTQSRGQPCLSFLHSGVEFLSFAHSARLNQTITLSSLGGQSDKVGGEGTKEWQRDGKGRQEQ